MSIRPMLFNTDMVRALREGRKTMTRRAVKPRYSDSVFERFKGQLCEASPFREPERLEDGSTRRFVRRYVPCKPPCKEGDVLWVRETWKPVSATVDFWEMGGPTGVDDGFGYQYKADGAIIWCGGFRPQDDEFHTTEIRRTDQWHPSIHMPKEAARLFLRVKDVRVERLQDITPEQIDAEGCKEYGYSVATGELMPSAPTFFKIIWNSTIKPADLPRYGWEANPWVWVIAFELTERPGEWPGEERL